MAALAVFGLLGVVLADGLSLGRRVWERAAQRSEAAADIDAVQHLLRTLIETARPAADGSPGIAAAASGLALAAPLPGAPGIRRVTLHRVADGRLLLDSEPPGGDPPNRLVLLDGVERLDVVLTPRPGPAARVPPLVRVDLAFAAPGRVWPSLAVEPRITHPANCRFDAVSRGCRLTGAP